MSVNGHQGHSVSVGHEPDTASSSRRQIIQLKCPQWFSSGKYLAAPNPDIPNGNFSSFADFDGPKRRGRPPKTGSHQSARSSNRAKPSTLPKPVGTRSSKRKLAEVNDDAHDQDIDFADAPSGEHQDQAAPSHPDESQDQSGQISIRGGEADSSAMDLDLDDSIDRSRSTALTNGHSPAKKNSENAFTTPPILQDAGLLEPENLNQDPIASIEAHEQLNDDEDEEVGVVTRSAARSKSAGPIMPAAKGPFSNMAANAEDSFSTANDAAEDISAPGTPKGKGRGRWPNGALKAKAAAAGVSTATLKKALGKKKGAPGKRKTSDNAVVQAAYDRQAHLRSQYKDLRKMLLKSEVVYLERTLEEFQSSADAFMDTPNYEEVMKFLEQRRTAVVANREKEEQLHKQLLQRQFDGEVSNTWQIFSGTVDNLMVKYGMKAKRAYLDIVQRQRSEEDEYLTDAEVEGGEYDLDRLDDVVAEQESLTEAPTPEDNEPVKRGRAATKPKRGKKRALDDEPLVQQIAKRHAPAMLSATTHPEEVTETEADKPAAPLPIISAGPRGKNKYHFDQKGVFVPTEAKKGPQREEPNNRVVIEPWFSFEPHEIGLRNLYDEKNELKPKPQFPTGYWHLDPHRGVYNILNREEDYDQKLVRIFGVHPTMGLPCKGSRNPDDAFKHTDYTNVLKNIPTPLRYIDAEHPEPTSTSKSWEIITTARDWLQFEREMRMDPTLDLKARYGQKGLATYDLEARAHTDGIFVVDDLLEAAEALERETPKPATRTVSPSPGKRQSARQRARAEAAAAKARAVTPLTPISAPQQLPAPPITSTASLSILADASELVQRALMPSPPAPHRHAPSYSYHRSPPPPRTQSQLPHISFINNPMPPSDLRPLAPQPQQAQHHPESRPYLQPRPQPMEMQRQYERPGMMAPPPLQPRMPLPFPGMQSHQPHPPALFYGQHPSPPQQPQPPQRPNLRPGPGLRSLLPRTMPGDPPGPSPQHHHINHQQVNFYNSGPPPPPQHIPQEHQRFYDSPSQHISPYRNEPYQPYTPGPPGPPPGYGPFRHHSPRR